MSCPKSALLSPLSGLNSRVALAPSPPYIDICVSVDVAPLAEPTNTLPADVIRMASDSVSFSTVSNDINESA